MVHQEAVFGLETGSPKGSRKQFFLGVGSIFKLEFFLKCDPKRPLS